MKRSICHACVCAVAAAELFMIAPRAKAQGIFPLMPSSVSTVPGNGDLNPSGVAFVPRTVPAGAGLQPHDVLVSNFNNSRNLEGTGNSIVRIDTSGHATLFYQSIPGVTGMTAALGVLSNGWVLAGNLPSLDGTVQTIQPGSISIIKRNGSLFSFVFTVLSPMGMAVYDNGSGGTGTAHVFVSDAGGGTVMRLDLSYTPYSVSVNQQLKLASGFGYRPDFQRLLLGPAGIAYDPTHDVLYVADSLDNSIYQIVHAATVTSEQVATQFIADVSHLHGPLGMAILPNGHLVIADADSSYNTDPNQPSELVEYTAQGTFVNQMSIDPNIQGASGVAVENLGWGTVRLAFVDDNASTVSIRTLVVQ